MEAPSITSAWRTKHTFCIVAQCTACGCLCAFNPPFSAIIHKAAILVKFAPLTSPQTRRRLLRFTPCAKHGCAVPVAGQRLRVFGAALSRLFTSALSIVAPCQGSRRAPAAPLTCGAANGKTEVLPCQKKRNYPTIQSVPSHTFAASTTSPAKSLGSLFGRFLSARLSASTARAKIQNIARVRLRQRGLALNAPTGCRVMCALVKLTPLSCNVSLRYRLYKNTPGVKITPPRSITLSGACGICSTFTRRRPSIRMSSLQLRVKISRRLPKIGRAVNVSLPGGVNSPPFF